VNAYNTVQHANRPADETRKQEEPQSPPKRA